MFQFTDRFHSYDENKQPYCFSVERHTETANLHAGVITGGFSLKSIGNRHILNTPLFSCGQLRFPFHITYMKEFDPVFTVFFQYDEATRCGLGVKIHYHLSGGLDISLVETRSNLLSVKETCTFDSALWEEGKSLPFCLDIRETGIVCSVTDCSAAFSVKNVPGKIALERENFMGDLVLEEIYFSTPDNLLTQTLCETTAQVPCVNGGDIPYAVTWKLEEVCGQVYLRAELNGGTKTRRVNREDRMGQYGVEKDVMTDPYVGFSCGKQDHVFQLAPGDNWFIDPNVYWDCQKEFFHDTKLPVEGIFPADITHLSDDFTFIFGYEKLSCAGYASQIGGREFRFDQFGKLVYDGAPLDGRDSWCVLSPFDKNAISLLPSDCWHLEEAIHHLQYNHYFENTEAVCFTLEYHTRIFPEYLSLSAEIQNVFETQTLHKADLPAEAEPWEKDYYLLRGKVTFPPMVEGVYKVCFRVFYGTKLYREIKHVFEVYDRCSSVSPAVSTGLPYIFSMPYEQKWLMRNSFDMWNPIESCDVEHYISCITDTPIEAETRQVWKVLKPFKREWYAWLAMNTCNDPHAERHNDIKKHADYLYYAIDNPAKKGGKFTGRGFPFRLNHWEYPRFNCVFPRDNLTEFLVSHPGAAEYIGYDEQLDRLSPETFEKLSQRYGVEWVSFLNAKVLEVFRKQNHELTEMNPDFRRSWYGPFNIYTMPTVSYRTLSVFGLPENNSLAEDVYTGFSVFEDYPYACSYQTYRGAFAMMTILLHAPKARLYPEQYSNGAGGCIDGAVKFAHPPMGAYTIEPYQNSTQSFEYVFNTPHRLADGYHYWSTYGFHRRDYTAALMDGMIKNWRYVLEYKPAKPIRSIAYLADYDTSDDVFQVFPYEKGRKYTLSNKSEMACGLIHECSREAGIPNGFALKFDTLETLQANECDVLVLPTLKNATEQNKNAIRRLFNNGVNLIATSDISGLEDIFGVQKAPYEADIHSLCSEDGMEHVFGSTAKFGYVSQGAKAVVCADGNPVLLSTNRTLLINTNIDHLGCEVPWKVNVSSANHFVGTLLRNILRDELHRLSSPLVLGKNVGTTLFKTESGKTVLLAMDYTPFDNQDHAEKEAVVEIHMSNVQQAVSERDLFVGKKNGSVQELRFSIKPHESVFIELIAKEDGQWITD